jgi:hypothetical protein
MYIVHFRVGKSALLLLLLLQLECFWKYNSTNSESSSFFGNASCFIYFTLEVLDVCKGDFVTCPVVLWYLSVCCAFLINQVEKSKLGIGGNNACGSLRTSPQHPTRDQAHAASTTTRDPFIDSLELLVQRQLEWSGAVFLEYNYLVSVTTC